ncbi:MAG: 5'-methylthioadenosine/S-adenosylhomocysteine nucleosidase [Clostridia bacterium]|nr:5'-methylthioadenosine/S-adenosylhomocysteine nucleosidase [Clostridia bacterium]
MIGIVAAMQCEADIVLEEMNVQRSLTVSGKQIHVGTAYGKETAVCICGVGKVNAALGTQILVSKFDVKSLFNLGVAGGLNSGTELCQIYQIEAAVQFDFDLTQLNRTKMGTLDEYTENYLPVQTLSLPFPVKKLGTSDRFNDSPADYQLLTKELGADIRDMEGAAIAQAALCAKLPFYSLKAISDVAGSGSTTEQFLQNKNKALQNLKAVLPTVFEKL